METWRHIPHVSTFPPRASLFRSVSLSALSGPIVSRFLSLRRERRETTRLSRAVCSPLFSIVRVLIHGQPSRVSCWGRRSIFIVVDVSDNKDLFKTFVHNLTSCTALEVYWISLASPRRTSRFSQTFVFQSPNVSTPPSTEHYMEICGS